MPIMCIYLLQAIENDDYEDPYFDAGQQLNELKGSVSHANVSACIALL